MEYILDSARHCTAGMITNDNVVLDAIDEGRDLCVFNRVALALSIVFNHEA